jgi:hypothetical protein
MADYNINAVTRRVVYSGSAGTGPYAFSFEVLVSSDIVVYFNSTSLTLTTDYTVTINANGTGSVTIVTGTNVPTTPDASDTIIIVGARDIERTTDFVTAGDLLAASLNEQLDGLTIFDQQIAEEQKRSLMAPVYDPAHADDGGTLDMTLPAKANRLGKYLAFNATTGNPEAGPSTTDVTTLAAVTSDIATLADIEDGTDATDAIQTVAGISANVTTVAGISANVTTVAGNTSNINAVAADATDIGTVAGISANVTTVAGISSDVTTVAADGTDIGTVAGISANVTTVAGISSDVTTVAGISGDVSSVAAQVIGYDFSTTTAMADPGSGNVRFNNATVASVTAIAIDDLDKNGVDQSAYIALFDDSTNTVKGTLVFRTGGGDVATFNITGLTDNTGWFQIAVTHVASGGTFSNGEDTFIGFTRAGDKGADGAGSGDVSGPGSATDNAVVRWDGTSGQLVQNSGVTINDSGDLAANNFSGTHSGTSSGTNTGDEVAASESTAGVVELATTAEAEAGTDTARAVTPAGAAAAIAALAVSGATDAEKSNIMLNSFRIAEQGGLTVQGMVDGVSDVFTDESGVDTATSTDEAYNAAGDYYENPGNRLTTSADFTGAVASYDLATDGHIDTLADNSAIYDDTNLISGDFEMSFTYTTRTGTGGVTGMGIGFILDSATGSFAGSPGGGGVYGNLAAANVPMGIRNAVNTIIPSSTSGDQTNISFTDADVGIFKRVGSTLTFEVWRSGVLDSTTTFTSTTTADLRFTYGTNAATGDVVDDITFVRAVVNPVHVSQTFTALSQPDTAFTTIWHEDVDACTPNTDFTVEVSRDAGTTWTVGTLALAATLGAAEILTCSIDISAQPAGTSIRWRFKFLNTLSQRLRGVGLQWS